MLWTEVYIFVMADVWVVDMSLYDFSQIFLCLWHCLERLQSFPVGFLANSKGAFSFGSLACAAVFFRPLLEMCVWWCFAALTHFGMREGSRERFDLCLVLLISVIRSAQMGILLL